MDMLQHLRFAARSLRRSPVLALAVIVTLALCTGATTAVFSVVYAVLFRPLPYRDPEGLLLVREVWRGNERLLRFSTARTEQRVSLPDKLF